MPMYNDDEQIKIESPDQDASDTSAGTQSYVEPEGKTKLTIKRKEDAPLAETDFKVLVELTGTADLKDRCGLDLVVVLDVSLSMDDDNGKKLNKMKTAMQFVIKKLTPNDRLSVVTFARTGDRRRRLMQMTANAQKDIGELVGSLRTGPYTNIVDGLRVGKQVVDGRKITAGRAAAIMLMSDGVDNVNGRNIRQVLNRQIPVWDVPVYTFGFGMEQDAQLLQEIATKSSRGTYSDVQNEENLTLAFSQCLAGLQTIIAPDLTLTVIPEKNSKIVSVSVSDLDYPQSTEDDGSVTILFGDLFSRETRKAIVYLRLSEIKPRKGRTSVPSTILQVNYTYTYAEGILFRAEAQLVEITRSRTAVTQEIEDILIEEDRLSTLKAIKDAIAEADRGNLRGAVSILEAALDSLNRAVYQPNEMTDTMKYELKRIIDLMKDPNTYKTRGRPFALSYVTSHGRQRYATKGDTGSDLKKMRSYATKNMNTSFEQAERFDKNPNISLPSAKEDAQLDLKNDPFAPIAVPLANNNQRAILALKQNEDIIENVKTLEDIENIARNVETGIQSLQKMLASIGNVLKT
ncbi:uncharacterized protein LOC126667494 [Mercurialis annua]|uniref:uncharacterized protein LOC126667494 n=1 Tax=Mercurialis annua TaxID=3986 RepID=UPI00215FEEF2|nr:uncharacterized protein LOC126667494 [Mercurialis annua]